MNVPQYIKRKTGTMKRNRIIALALPALLALASCDNNLTAEQPERQPSPYIVNETGDTLYLVTPQISMAPTAQATRATEEPKSYDAGNGLTLQVIPDPAVETRGANPLTDGVHVYCVLYDAANKVYTKDYTVNGGNLTGEGGLYLPAGEYDAYCFTYNQQTAFPESYIQTSAKEITVPQGVDAAWNSNPYKLTVSSMYSPNKIFTILKRKCAQISKITFEGADETVTYSDIQNVTLQGVSTEPTTVPFSDTPSVNGAGGHISIPDAGFTEVSGAATLTYMYSTPTFLIPQRDGLTFSCNVTIDGNAANYTINTSSFDPPLSGFEAGHSYSLKLKVTI
jgi:hypothetical protein